MHLLHSVNEVKEQSIHPYPNFFFQAVNQTLKKLRWFERYHISERVAYGTKTSLVAYCNLIIV
jgi:hypothetical protein